MANDLKELLITGLKNAHSLEKQAEDLLQNQYSRLDAYPELKERVGRHIEETRDQIARLDQCLDGLGSSRSVIKDTVTQVAANVQSMVHAATSDEVLKNTFASFAFENFEIASYKALITIAEMADEPAVAEACRVTLGEEEDMADWLDDHLDDTVRTYAERVETGQEGYATA